jgi:hypothetical protein
MYRERDVTRIQVTLLLQYEPYIHAGKYGYETGTEEEQRYTEIVT